MILKALLLIYKSSHMLAFCFIDTSTLVCFSLRGILPPLVKNRPGLTYFFVAFSSAGLTV